MVTCSQQKQCFHRLVLLSFTAPPKVEYDKKVESQTVKAGSMFIIGVTVSGVPNPKVSWFLNDQQITASSTVSIDTTSEYSTLQVKGTTSKEAGKYKVVAENKVGTDSAEFTVSVMGE